MQILDGRIVAQKIKIDLTKKVNLFIKTYKKKPFLMVLLVGDNPASQVYVRHKVKAADDIGIKCTILFLSKNISVAELKQVIQELNKDTNVHAILVQLPLPALLPSKKVLSWINPEKDPDCLTVENQGLAWSGQPRVVSCTPLGIIKLLKHYNISLKGKNAVVVGRSQIVGLPMAQLLLKEHATVTVCHSHTQNISFFTQRADIIVVAAGCPEFLGKTDFKKGAVVVDVGIHRVKKQQKNKLVGDIRFAELKNHVAFATPVPGGVGPMTVTMLLHNTIILANLLESKNRNNND